MSKGIPDEIKTIKVKELQLDKVIFKELAFEENKWIDYEFEETQTKLDIADMILSELAEEVVIFLNTNHN